MKLGYVRVSTSDQDASLQRDALKASGCEQCAQETQRIIGGTVHSIEPIRPPGYKGPVVLGKYRGANPDWHHHEVMVKDGRVYDAFTGNKGLEIDEFKDLFEYRGGYGFWILNLLKS